MDGHLSGAGTDASRTIPIATANIEVRDQGGR
jgi:hypothetical protein